jgi:hypothetical protein
VSQLLIQVYFFCMECSVTVIDAGLFVLYGVYLFRTEI